MPDPLTIARNGASDYVIALRRDADAVEQFAAAELQRYLQRMSGVELPVRSGGRGARRIVIDGRARQVGDGDAFAIRRGGRTLFLEGATSRAALYAVYGLLEDVFGCGWLAPGDEVVPMLRDICIDELDVREAPAFEQRMLVHFPVTDRILDQIDWAAKQRLNVTFLAVNNDLHLWDELKVRERILPEVRRRGLELHGVGHALFAWLPPERYFAAHPEYYALIDGRRDPGLSLCVTNPAAAKQVAENILAFRAQNPEVSVVTLWHNDHNRWCECPDCARLLSANCGNDGPAGAEPSVTEAHLGFVNRVAEHVAAHDPEFIVELLAYDRTYRPSGRVRPAANVQIGYALFEKFRRPAECFTSINSPRHPNRETARDLRNWRRLTDRLYLYEYFGLLHDFAPLWPAMRKDFQFYQRLGALGISSEIAGWNALHLYFFAKLSWDPQASVATVLNHYCRRAYGPAADTMAAFWRELCQAQACWNWDSARRDELDESPGALLSWLRQQPGFPELETRCLDLLHRASEQLRRYPLDRHAPVNAADANALSRVRAVMGRWHEGALPWAGLTG